MADSTNLGEIINIIVTVILGMIVVIALFVYMYIDIRHLFRDRDRRWKIGLMAFLSPLVGVLAGIGILMIWNPSIRPLFWMLVIFAMVLSIILWQSIVSPYKLADWWGQLGAWIKKKDKDI